MVAAVARASLALLGAIALGLALSVPAGADNACHGASAETNLVYERRVVLECFETGRGLVKARVSAHILAEAISKTLKPIRIADAIIDGAFDFMDATHRIMHVESLVEPCQRATSNVGLEMCRTDEKYRKIQAANAALARDGFKVPSIPNVIEIRDTRIAHNGFASIKADGVVFEAPVTLDGVVAQGRVILRQSMFQDDVAIRRFTGGEGVSMDRLMFLRKTVIAESRATWMHIERSQWASGLQAHQLTLRTLSIRNAEFQGPLQLAGLRATGTAWLSGIVVSGDVDLSGMRVTREVADASGFGVIDAQLTGRLRVTDGHVRGAISVDTTTWAKAEKTRFVNQE